MAIALQLSLSNYNNLDILFLYMIAKKALLRNEASDSFATCTHIAIVTEPVRNDPVDLPSGSSSEAMGWCKHRCGVGV